MSVGQPGFPTRNLPYDSSLSSARGASIAGPVRHPPHPRPHLPSPPVRSPAEPGVLPRGAPALPTRRRSRVLRPGGIVYHPQQKRPKQPWVGGSPRGAGPPPRPRRPRGRRAPAHVQPQRCTVPRNAFRPPRVAPRTPALCPNPNSPLAPSGSEGCARPPGSKPAPALGRTFQLALVPTTSEPGAPAGARGAGAPRANTYRLLAGSGPEPPGWATASQRSTAERQVELHDWGGAGGRPGGQTRELRAQRLRAQSGAGADCAATPRQVSPPEQHCLPRTDLRERSWGSAFPGPCTTERAAKRELDFPKLELDSSLDPYPSPWPSSLLTFFFFFF